MNLTNVIAELRIERERLDLAILSLERLCREQNVSHKEPTQRIIRELKGRGDRPSQDYLEAKLRA
jgi:hypothetical protein